MEKLYINTEARVYITIVMGKWPLMQSWKERLREWQNGWRHSRRPLGTSGCYSPVFEREGRMKKLYINTEARVYITIVMGNSMAKPLAS